MVKYMITDGRSYIRRNKDGTYSAIRSRSLGDVWEERHKACNILESCLNKNLRNRYRVVDYEDGEEEAKQETEIEEPELIPCTEKAAELAEEEMVGDVVESWRAKAEMLVDMVSGADARKEELDTQFSEVTNEINDIYHYIELFDLDKEDAYTAYIMLKKRLKKRRQIKDEQYILQILGDSKLSKEEMELLRNEIKKLGTRRYMPRILKELFTERGGK